MLHTPLRTIQRPALHAIDTSHEGTHNRSNAVRTRTISTLPTAPQLLPSVVMWLLVELIILPVLIVSWIVLSTLAQYVGLGALLLGIVVLLLAGTVVGLILRFLWRLETEAGIHDEAHSK